MVRSFPRNNFLDILRAPAWVTFLSSIALHALLGAYLLPLITKPQPEGKKAAPGTVKVLELTPNELQRIPRAPEPIPTPTPAQQTLPPVYQPSTPVAPKVPQIFSTSIPISPVRTPPKKSATKPAKATKSQPAKAQKPSKGVTFDPNIFAPVPSPKPSKPPAKKGVTSKNSPKPIPKPSVKPTQIKTKPGKKKPVTVKPQPSVEQNTDDDGGDQNPPNTIPATPRRTSQRPATPLATPSTPSKSSGGSESLPNSSSGGGNGVYGKYTQVANERLLKYVRENPGIKQYPPKLLSQKYPAGMPCTNVKQPPFIVLMVAFGKVPQGQNTDILGESTAPSIDKPYVAGDADTPTNKKLAAIAVDTALYEANKADRTREEADKGKSVLYQYRVQFDPATCKNSTPQNF